MILLIYAHTGVMARMINHIMPKTINVITDPWPNLT